MSQVKYPFNPILGSEEKVFQQDPVSGAVYFTTDTRKIYLDIDSEKAKIPMGGNIGLFYGKMTLTSPPADGQEEFEFAITDILGNESEDHILQPNVDDLILNSDGCFYKVLSSYGQGIDTFLNTKKLTIAGSGGGGGGNSSSNPDSLAGMALSRLKSDNGNTVLYQSSCPISFAVKVTDDLGDPQTGNVGVYDLYIDNVKKASGTVKGCTIDTPLSDFGKLNLSDVNVNELNIVDVGSYLPLKQNIIVKISVTTSDGYQSTRTISVSTTDMTLTWDYDETTLNYYDAIHEDMELNWHVNGNIEKTTHIIIDDNYSQPITVTSTKTDQSYKLNFKELNLNHGAHKIEMYVTANIGNGTAKTPSVFKNIIVVEENSTTTIISVGLFERELIQYNTIKIPIFIYDPMNTGGTATVVLRENGEAKDTWQNVQNLDNSRYWAYTPIISGDIGLMVQSGGVDKSFTISVKKLDIDVEEVSGYAFKFKANEFASDTNVQNWFSNGVTATFSENFDWINGGVDSETTEDGNNKQYFNIKAGSTMTINYPLFKQTAKTAGKTFKIIFKSTNCRDYDARILTCKRDKKIVHVNEDEEIYLVIENGEKVTYSNVLSIENDSIIMNNTTEETFDLTSAESRTIFNNKYVYYDNTIYLCKIKKVDEKVADDQAVFYSVFFNVEIKDSFEGLLMNAQYATFNSRNQTITTQYCEDHYIELELDISKQDDNGVKNYITFWVDGVPSGYVVYDKSDSFIDNTNQYITIGSDDCDVRIYAIKVYEKSLSDEQHLQNFIADAPGATEMVNRYNRNNILDERNEISPTKLAKANPECLVHIYNIDRMTIAKDDEVSGCSYSQYKGSDQATLSAENVTIKVQGTSSQKYVVAAANLDTSFNDGFIDANGNHLDGWAMTQNSIPIDFTCTKVNVASCENANNALNQEWYNMFQPYQTLVRCKNPKARDTMQFVNGVLFVQDNNETYVTSGQYDAKNNNVFGDTIGYIKNPYPKMYSLGQMGNSKENTKVFHDTENPLECCVEVSDNQEPQQWMVSYDYSDSDIDNGKEYYGFRYPKKLKGLGDEQKTTMRNNWRRFVQWMATSNPQPMYEEHKATTEKEFKAFSYNQKQHKNIEVFVLNAEKTEYISQPTFNPAIDTYYTKTEHVHGYTNLPLPEPVSFDAYTFRGYKANEELQKDYNPLIAGCTVSQYATKKTIYDYKVDENGDLIYDLNNQPIIIEGSGRTEDTPYTHDTYEYRMAKMLSECEDYLCMDSVIYHYLFIERHCMIDNVAKNTFWSTEDGNVWNLTKNYDNDTADGNDNNGKFTRTYGMEPLDKLNRNTYVFNAHQSVWFNFINGLHEACEWMFQQLEKKTIKLDNRNIKVWNKDDYLWLFNKWQSMIPERCWIEDYYRKYRRPFEVYNDNMFNSMMEGGQKKYQRAQYETYQDIYMSSKYFGVSCSGSYSIIRGNGKGLLGYQLPVTTYSDCYIHVHVGSSKSSHRAKRNQMNYLECPADSINNATVYFYPISAFSTLGSIDGGQVGAYEPEQISFSGANKLRELIISTADNSVVNETLKDSFSVNNNLLLEKLYVANFTKYESNLDLSKCPNLRELDASNSTFTAVTLADGAPVEKIKIYKPTALEFSNLRKVNELSINDFSRLSILNLNNVDSSPAIDSKELVNNSSFLENYKLTNVDWKINNSNEVYYVNSSDCGITTLDFLLKRSPIETGKGPELQENSLTGNLTIMPSGYNGNSYGALSIYEKYSKAKASYERVIYTTEDAFNNDIREKFIKENDEYTKVTDYDPQKEYYIEKLIAEYPNLNIEFKGNLTTLYTVNIHDGDGNIVWKRKIIPDTSIDEDFLKYGPTGSFKSSNIYKSNTAEFEYKFLKQWNVKDDKGNQLGSTINRAEPTNILVNSNIHLYPVFETKLRSYSVTVKAKHPQTKVIEVLKEDSYEFGTPFANIIPQDIIPYADSSDLPLLHAYDFKGYSFVEDSKVRVPDTYTVNGEITLWAIFELNENIRTVVHPEWFDISVATYQESDDTKYYGTVGYKLKPKYKLKGKVTIPATVSLNGIEGPVISLDNFGVKSLSSGVYSEQEITHIFMEDGKENKLYEICEYAFNKSPKLVYFDFEKCAVRTIRSYGFAECENLINTSFGEQLFQVYPHGFNLSCRSDSPVTVSIPATLKGVNNYSFGIMGFAEGSTLEIGSENDLSALELSADYSSTFAQNEGNKFSIINFYSQRYDAGNELAIAVFNEALALNGTLSIV